MAKLCFVLMLAATALFAAASAPASAQDQCLQLSGAFHCQADGTITYTLQATTEYEFDTDETVLQSLTPGVSSEAIPMTPVPGSGITAWVLDGAAPGQTIQLRASAAMPGDIPGTELVCSGEIEETVPLDVCEGEVPPDLEVTTTGPATCEAGENCRFHHTVRNASTIPFEGVPILRNEPGVTGARLGTVGPSDTQWSCLQANPEAIITCVGAPMQLAPGESTTFFVNVRVPRSMSRNSTFENCAVQAPPDIGPNPVLFTQFMLRTLGYDPGPIDGLMGPRTGAAIAQFQEDADLEPTGEVNEDVLDVLTTLGGVDANPENDRDCAEVRVTKTITCGWGEQVVGDTCRPICSDEADWNGSRCVTCDWDEYWDEDLLRCIQEAPDCNERTTVPQGNRCVCRYFGMVQVNERRCRCPRGTDLIPGIGCVAEEAPIDCHDETTERRGNRCVCRYDDMERVNERRCRCPAGTELREGRGCVAERPDCDERTTERRGNRCACRYDDMERVDDRRCRCPAGTDLVPGQGCVAPAPEQPDEPDEPEAPRACPAPSTLQGDRCICPNGRRYHPQRGCRGRGAREDDPSG